MPCTRSVLELGPAAPITLFAAAPPLAGDAVLTVTASTLSRDAGAANDSASVTVTVLAAPVADLQVEQSVSFAADGRSPVFVVTASNLGPDWVYDARVVEVLSGELTDVTWSCTSIVGSTSTLGACSPIGSDYIDDRVSLSPQSRVEYLVSTVLAPDFEGLLSSTVTVTPPNGVHDPDLASNSHTVSIDYGLLFSDGFESGDVTSWSQAVGGTP